MRLLNEKYKNGNIGKKEYADAMMDFHRLLMEYPEWIKDSLHLQGIQISSEGVVLQIVDDLSTPKVVKMLLSSRTDSRCASMQLLNFGECEEEELKMFRKIVDILRPQTFFDIGANEGWYSFHMLCRFPKMMCYSFEPIPESYERTKKNFHINGLGTEGLYNIGLSDEEGQRTFYYNNAETGAASMRNLREKENILEIACTLKTLDNVIQEENIQSMDMIKIDVEGSELFVLKGGMQSIKKFKPIIFCEMLRKWCAKFDYHPNDIITLLGGGWILLLQNRKWRTCSWV